MNPTDLHCDNGSVFEGLMMYRTWKLKMRLKLLYDKTVLLYLTVCHIDDIDIFCLSHAVFCGSLMKIWS